MNKLAAMLMTLVAAVILAGCIEPPNEGEVYQLTEASRFEEGCFGRCMCPVVSLELDGSFELVEAETHPIFDVFEVNNVDWAITRAGEEVLVSGSGTYHVGREFAVEHRLELDLVIGDEPVEHFDSGFVAGGFEFPAITIRVSKYGEQCFDSVFAVSAEPLP